MPWHALQQGLTPHRNVTEEVLGHPAPALGNIQDLIQEFFKGHRHPSANHPLAPLTRASNAGIISIPRYLRAKRAFDLRRVACCPAATSVSSSASSLAVMTPS